MLSDMGLSGMHVMSDYEALSIRGSGFSWWVGSTHHFRLSVHKFHKWVRHFQKHTKHFHHSIWVS